MNNLAGAYWSARQLDKSVPLFEETLKLQERKLGQQHPDTQRTVANLGVNYKDAGRVQEALPLLEEAFQTAKINPTFRWVGPQLLDGYATAGKTAEAARLVTELLADVRKQLPKDSSQLAGELAQLGLSLLQTHAFTDAEALLRECLAIREQTMPDGYAQWPAGGADQQGGKAVDRGSSSGRQAQEISVRPHSSCQQRGLFARRQAPSQW
jgi:tetratricopeptide (TPR) repeat protein